MSNIDKLHIFGFKGILDILFVKGTFKKFPFWFSLIFSALFTFSIFIINAEKLYDIVSETSNLLLSFFPSLLGFSLGGYALVVGFSNSELIKKGSDVTNHSLYQILSAIFALSIIFQVFTTILCFSVVWTIKSDFLNFSAFNFGYYGFTVNAFILFLLLFGSIYSLFLTPYVVTNLFTLSQLNNLHFTIEQSIEDWEEEQKNKELKDTN